MYVSVCSCMDVYGCVCMDVRVSACMCLYMCVFLCMYELVCILSNMSEVKIGTNFYFFFLSSESLFPYQKW